MKDNLKKYKQKRNFNKTKEPEGKSKKSTKVLRFVVQHHLASRDHYDFRLEWKGTLKSWAVPKGPSYNPEDKRLAVQVEDHPFDYRNFEGIIPKGEYGGGIVMIWDEGDWEPLNDIEKGFREGSLKFTLKGKRLKGNWALVHMKEDNWLIIKEKDEYSKNEVYIDKFDRSIRTGRTMEEIEKGKIKNKIKKTTSKDDKCVIEKIKISNPDKILFDVPEITKRDLILYYTKVYPRMKSYLDNRLISTIRCPDGTKGECFFKKHLDAKNKGFGKVKIPSESDRKEDYYYIKDISGLVSEVQMNAIEFHIWGSSTKTLNKPDMMVFDLDPDEGMGLKQIRDGVKDLKSILDELSLTSFLKTSGGKGYHVVVPMKPLTSWTKFREFAKNIAKLMEAKWPDKYVSNVRKINRKNKIFVDWIRNNKSATSVAPYSVRIREGAPVSMPISWNELDKIKPNEITIEEAIKRLRRKDPWEKFFDIDQQLNK